MSLLHVNAVLVVLANYDYVKSVRLLLLIKLSKRCKKQLRVIAAILVISPWKGSSCSDARLATSCHSA